MPVLEFHLVESQFTAEQHETLLRRSAALYATVLRSPIDRIRVFITLQRPDLFLAAGEIQSDDPNPAPYFTFLVLEGRPVEERQRLLAGFTDIVVEVLGVERSRVRGGCRRIAPEDWAIGGVPASVQRAAEVEERALAEPPRS
jgi:4-oxalocrotonate tautomerase